GAAALWPSLSTEFGPRPAPRARRHTRSFSARPPGRPDTEAAPRERRQCSKRQSSVPPSKGEGRAGKMRLSRRARTPTSPQRVAKDTYLQEDLMTLRSDRHLATLCSSTALLLRGRLVDKAPGARLLIKARALHSDTHRRSRIYGRNRIPHSNT